MPPQSVHLLHSFFLHIYLQFHAYSHMALLTLFCHTARHGACHTGVTDAALPSVGLAFPPVTQLRRLITLPPHRKSWKDYKFLFKMDSFIHYPYSQNAVVCFWCSCMLETVFLRLPVQDTSEIYSFFGDYSQKIEFCLRKADEIWWLACFRGPQEVKTLLTTTGKYGNSEISFISHWKCS